MIPLFDDNPHRRTPVVVVMIIAINVVALLVEFSRPSEHALARFIFQWGLVPAALWRDPDPQVWLTPITAMFLHGGWMHLIGNCWFFWIFGNNIEDRLGHGKFVVFYLLSGLGAAAMQVAVSPWSVVPMIGASGAVSGVLGAYLRYFPRAPVYTLVPLWFAPIVPIPAFIFIVVWFVFQFWQGIGAVFGTATAGGVAWWAHVGGCAAGYLLAGPMHVRRGRR